MKKVNFLQGALIASAAIIFSKIIGILYVIPFHAIIGEKGGALYGYSYNIYNIFLIISAAGIPLAISKLASEYNALGKTEEKLYMYNFTKKVIYTFSIISFLICFFGSNIFASIILGDLTGGNTVEDVAYVIKCVSFAILIVPLLSISRGFLQGHSYIKDSSISQVIEQIIRVTVIIVGSYLALEVFNTSLKEAVGIAVFGAFVGAIVGLLYLSFKLKKVKPIQTEITLSIKDKKNIRKKLYSYAVPFILVNLSYYLYTSIDMILVIRTLDYIGYDALVIEEISSIFTTWGSKLNSIVTSVALGLVISLVPNMSASHAKGNKKEVKDLYQKSIELLIYFILPISLFLSIYADKIWYIFYGYSTYGPLIFRFTALVAFIDCLYLIMGNVLQNLNKRKLLIISLSLGLGLNALLDVPLMLLFNKIDIYPFYGAITATFIGYLVSSLVTMRYLKKEENLTFSLSKLSTGIFLSLVILIPLNLIFNLLLVGIFSKILLIIILGILFVFSGLLYIFLNKNYFVKLFKNTFLNKVLN